MTKRFKIVLLPAKREKIGRTFTWEPLASNKYPTTTVAGDTTADAIAGATAFATAHGEPCFAMVSCLNKPFPRGFKKATDSNSNDCWFNVPAIGATT